MATPRIPTSAETASSVPIDLIEELLARASASHRHLCPRQVLGVRMGLFAAELLEVEAPQQKKRLLAIVETDGCFTDGIAVALNCWVGRRTMRIEDYGKVAVTVVDTATDRAIRIVPHAQSRTLAHQFADNPRNKWEAMLNGYKHMPADLLFTWQEVALVTPAGEIVSRAGLRAVCDICGEEILNNRQITAGDRTLCRGCAGHAYYASLD